MADPEEFDEELQYPNEEIDGFVQTAAEEVLKDAMWDEVKVPQWIN